MRSLNLDQVQTLVTIADLGTFAAAAQALHLAPPTVSLHVSELESRLGATLIERGHRRARLTAAGAALVERARRLLKDADDAAEQVRRVAEGRAGKVRLGSSTGVIVHLLPQVLEALTHGSPGIDVELDIVSSADAMGRLHAGTLDVAIVALPQAPGAEVHVSAWRSDPMMAFLPQQWKVPRRVTPQWLAQQPLICNDATTQMHRLTAEWFGQAGLTPRARIELNYTEAMKSLVIAGYGAAVLPLEQPHNAAQHDRMQLRPLNPPLVRHLGIAHRAPQRLDAAAHEVLRALGEFAQASRNVDA
jgi:DNA-binding transcriptional LysR family regulator